MRNLALIVAAFGLLLLAARGGSVSIAHCQTDVAAPKPAEKLAGNRNLIRLHNRSVAPGDTAGEANQSFYLKLKKPMNRAMRREIEAAGYAVLGYMGEETYVVGSLTGADLASLRRLLRGRANVLGTAVREDADVASPSVSAVMDAPPAGPAAFRVMFWPGVTGQAIDAVLQSVGARDIVVPRDNAGLPRADVSYFDIECDFGGIGALLRNPLIQFVDLAGGRHVSNQTAVAVARADLIEVPAAPYNLNGTGIVLGVWDGGGAQNHADFVGRVSVMDPYQPNNGGCQHATEVIGTLLGSGSGNAMARGFAPGATAFSYDFNGSVTMERRGLHHSNQHFIENHSWFVGLTKGGYDATANEFDFDAQDLQIIMCRAAGNTGPFDGTIYSDLASKNSIVVGAVDDNGQHTVNSDFSARGPMDDGRLCPHICANGVSITTTFPTDTYSVTDGTSFACPGVAGTLALLGQLWRRDHNNMRLWPDTAMAVLYQTAADRGIPGPDYQYGFGLIDAKAAADLILADEAGGGDHLVRGVARQDETLEYELNVASSATPLKVTLCWLDTPASPGAAIALVNDLDLELVDPTGGIHYPYSGLTGPGSQTTPFTQTGPNRRDNAEQAVITSPAVGLWRVVVRGYSVADAARPVGFVLACDRALTHNHAFYEDAASAPNNGTPVSIPDNDTNGLVYTFNVTQTENIEHVRLYVNLLHALRGQIDIRLTHPDGTEVRLEADENGVGDGNREDIYAIYPETRPGFEDVTPLYGKPANGLWTVRISDRQPGQPLGSLRYVALELEFDSSPSNDRPTADAGADQNAFELETVNLDGSASTDPEMQPLSFTWTQLSGPAVTLSGADTAAPSFTAPLVAAPTPLVFKLVVTDAMFSNDSDTVTVTLLKAPNIAPVANAGPDQAVDEGVVVTLDGTGSSDADLHPLTYLWTQVSGPLVTLSDSTSPTPSLTTPYVPADVQLVFSLQVYDIYMAGGTDIVYITVADISPANQPPVAVAGADQTVVAGGVVTLNATASSDPENNPLSYSWQQIGGSVQVTLNGSNSAVATFTAPQVNDTLVFRVTISDANNGVSYDTISVTVTGDVSPGGGGGNGSAGCAAGDSAPGSRLGWVLLIGVLGLARLAAGWKAHLRQRP